MNSKKKPTEEFSLQDVLNHLDAIENRLDKLERQNSELQTLLRVISQPVLWSALKTLFSKPKQLWAYELSNGERSTRDIGKIIGVDQKTISTWWRIWADEYNIAEKVGKRGQFKGQYNLLELLLLHSSPEDDAMDSI